MHIFFFCSRDVASSTAAPKVEGDRGTLHFLEFKVLRVLVPLLCWGIFDIFFFEGVPLKI